MTPLLRCWCAGAHTASWADPEACRCRDCDGDPSKPIGGWPPVTVGDVLWFVGSTVLGFVFLRQACRR